MLVAGSPASTAPDWCWPPPGSAAPTMPTPTASPMAATMSTLTNSERLCCMVRAFNFGSTYGMTRRSQQAGQSELSRQPTSFQWRRQAKSSCHHDQVGQGPRLHLSHDPTAMSLHGDFADAQFEADLLVQEPRDDQRHDLLLAAAERLVALAKSK